MYIYIHLIMSVCPKFIPKLLCVMTHCVKYADEAKSSQRISMYPRLYSFSVSKSPYCNELERIPRHITLALGFCLFRCCVCASFSTSLSSRAASLLALRPRGAKHQERSRRFSFVSTRGWSHDVISPSSFCRKWA